MKEDHGMHVLDESNMDEFSYRYFKTTNRGLFWKLRMKLKWAVMDLWEDFKSTDEVREFLYADLKNIKFNKLFVRKPMSLRYLNKEGTLVRSNFIVQIGSDIISIQESRNWHVKEDKGPKGPVTLRQATCADRKITSRGVRNIWEIQFSQIL